MENTGNNKESPPYSISLHELKFPFFTFGEGVKDQDKLTLLHLRPYKTGKGRKIKLFSIIRGGNSKPLLELKKMLEEEKFQKLLLAKGPDIQIVGMISEDDLMRDFYLYKDSLIIILHDKNMNNDYHDHIKFLAKKNNVRVQFIDITHLSDSNSFPFKGVMTQLIAKDDGIPWILDIEDNVSFYSNSMIIGISYSSKHGRLSYGVAHFIDLLNMEEKIEIIKGGLRTDSFRGLLLREEEFQQVINQAIRWYKSETSKSTESLHIFLYETAPIRKNNTKYVSDLIADPSKVGFKRFAFTHVHIKSTNYGVPRMYDISNVGYIPEYSYMQKRGTYIKVEMKSGDSSFSMKGEIIIGTTGFYLQNNSKPKGTKGTPVPLYAQVTSNVANILDIVADQVMKLAHLDWEYLFQEYRMPFMIKYSTILARFINQFCKTDQEFNDFPTLWDVRDLM